MTLARGVYFPVITVSVPEPWMSACRGVTVFVTTCIRGPGMEPRAAWGGQAVSKGIDVVPPVEAERCQRVPALEV